MYIRLGFKLNHADILPIHPIIYRLRFCSLKNMRENVLNIVNNSAMYCSIWLKFGIKLARP